MGDHINTHAAARSRRPLRPHDHLPAGVGDRPLRLPLRLLHVRAHELPAAGRAADARGARPDLHGLRRRGVRKLRITGGEPLVRKTHVAVRAPVAAPRGGGLDELTLTTNGSQLAALCRRSARRRRRAHQRLARHAASPTASAPSPAGATSRTCWTGIDAARGGRPQGQDQRRGAEGRQRGRDRRPDPLGARARLRPDADRDHAAGRDRRRPHRPVPAAVASCARACWTAGR